MDCRAADAGFCQRRDLNAILANATPAQDFIGSLHMKPDTIVQSVKEIVARPWRMRGRRCLREGLLAFYYLKLAGRNPLLRFGLLKGTLATSRPRAHCWIILDGEIILNPRKGQWCTSSIMMGSNPSLPPAPAAGRRRSVERARLQPRFPFGNNIGPIAP